MTAGFLFRLYTSVFFHKFIDLIFTPGIFMTNPAASDALYFTALVLVGLVIILCFRRWIHGMGAPVAGSAKHVPMTGGIPVQCGIGFNAAYTAMAGNTPGFTHPGNPARFDG